MQNAKEKMDLFGDSNGPSIVIEFDVYRNNYIDMIRRGGKIRLITEITKDNMNYRKALMRIVTSLFGWIDWRNCSKRIRIYINDYLKVH
jgi:hypothetical protein